MMRAFTWFTAQSPVKQILMVTGALVAVIMIGAEIRELIYATRHPQLLGPNNVAQYDHIACYDEADYDRFEMLWKSHLDYAERLSGLNAFITEMTLAGRCVLLAAGTPVTYEKHGATNRQCVRLPGDSNCAWTWISRP